MAEVLAEATPTIVEVIGEVELPKRGRVLRIALVDWGNDFGIGVDVRVFVTDAAHERRRAAQSRAQSPAERSTDHTGAASSARRNKVCFCSRATPTS